MQANPPKPSNALVSIERAPVETFAVTQFGGFLVDDYTLSSKAEALSEALLEDGIDNFDSDVYFVASYDPPYRLQHRYTPSKRSQDLCRHKSKHLVISSGQIIQ